MFFHVRRGFGRIRTDKHPGGFFVHYSEVQDSAQILVPRELVSFRLAQGPKGPFATKVKRLGLRLRGVLHHGRRGEWLVCDDDGQVYGLDFGDLLAGEGTFGQLRAGWQVQFSPLFEQGKSMAKEVVVCDTRPLLAQMARIDLWPEKLQALVALARPEPWAAGPSAKPWPLLENYLFETFRLLHQLGGLQFPARSRDLALWNTGLLTEQGEEIVCRMEAIQSPAAPRGYLASPAWRLSGFFPLSDRRLPQVPVAPPLALPLLLRGHESGAFFPETFFLQTALEADWQHLMERRERLPRAWQSLPEEQLLPTLQEALRRTLQRWQRQPSLAVPQYYENDFQWLLPLEAGPGSMPEAAWVLGKTGQQGRISTVLPLEWAYQNARLLGVQDDTWLGRAWQPAADHLTSRLQALIQP